MASTERPEAAVAREQPTTTRGNVDSDALFVNGDGDDNDDIVPLIHTAGALSPRANGAAIPPPPPDEIIGPPRRVRETELRTMFRAFFLYFPFFNHFFAETK